MTRILKLALVIVGVFAPTAVFAEGEAPVAEIKIKAATVAPKQTPWGELFNLYKKNVKDASGKQLIVKVYFGGTKGDEQSIVRQVYKGSLQIGGVSMGAMSAVVPEMDIFELPYLFDSYEQADSVLDGPARPMVEQLLEAKGFKLIMYSENGFRSFGTKEGFVKTPADLKARKMRSQESPVHVAMYRALGASPVTISVGEVLSSLQTGVVEGFDNTPLFTQAASWHQAISYYTVSEHIYQPALIVANKEFFDKLSPENQKVMLDQAKAIEQKGRKAVRALNPLLIENLKKQNVQVYTLTAAEKQAFKDATHGVWAKRREEASDAGKALLDTILKATGK